VPPERNPQPVERPRLQLADPAGRHVEHRRDLHKVEAFLEVEGQDKLLTCRETGDGFAHVFNELPRLDVPGEVLIGRMSGLEEAGLSLSNVVATQAELHRRFGGVVGSS